MARKMTKEQIERQQQLTRDRWNVMVRKEEERERRDRAQADARRKRMRAV